VIENQKQDKTTVGALAYKTFAACMTAYLEIKYNLLYAPISAIQIDPIKPTRRNSFNAACYEVDYEHACIDALANRPQLQIAFDIMLDEEAGNRDIDPELKLNIRSEVQDRVGKVLVARKLAPSKYFKPRKK
jgi:hypothetical protein